MNQRKCLNNLFVILGVGTDFTRLRSTSYGHKNTCQEWFPTIVRAEGWGTKRDFRQGEKTHLK